MKFLLRSFALAFSVFSANAIAGVTTVIEFEGTATAGTGDSPVTTSYMLNSEVGALPLEANQTASDEDLTLPGVGGAVVQGIAEITAERVNFAASNVGVGVQNSSTITTVTQQITNTNLFGANGTYQSILLPSAGFLAIDSAQALSAFDGGVEVNFDISLDGGSLFSMSVEILSDGTFNTTNTGFLNGFAQTTSSFANSFSWAETLLDFDLGFFAAGQTRELILTMQTNVFSNTGCAEITSTTCLFSGLTVGDPPGGGYGSIMLFSTYLPTSLAVPEPPLTLLFGAGLMALLARRRSIRL